jgi:hypothetical protein
MGEKSGQPHGKAISENNRVNGFTIGLFLLCPPMHLREMLPIPPGKKPPLNSRVHPPLHGYRLEIVLPQPLEVIVPLPLRRMR